MRAAAGGRIVPAEDPAMAQPTFPTPLHRLARWLRWRLWCANQRAAGATPLNGYDAEEWVSLPHVPTVTEIREEWVDNHGRAVVPAPVAAVSVPTAQKVQRDSASGARRAQVHALVDLVSVNQWPGHADVALLTAAAALATARQPATDIAAIVSGQAERLEHHLGHVRRLKEYGSIGLPHGHTEASLLDLAQRLRAWAAAAARLPDPVQADW